MLDIREFGTRERIIGDVVHPIIPPHEADKISSQNTNPGLNSEQQPPN